MSVKYNLTACLSRGNSVVYFNLCILVLFELSFHSFHQSLPYRGAIAVKKYVTGTFCTAEVFA